MRSSANDPAPRGIKNTGSVRTIVPGDGRFFTAEKGGRHAYRNADGTEIWQAGLSDELMYCDECP